MTVWFALPPEVHSALLSSGPGPESLLAAVEAWSALSTEFADAADELMAILGAVQAGAWAGPTAEQYVAAHGPYLGWLLDSAAKSTAAAALHQTAAAAYTAALASMPTLAELAANHAIHAVLVATNFFGINTIPIALNEADYVRMWVQAAETMTGYQAATESAVAAVPTTQPAPPIAKSADASPTQQLSNLSTSWQDQLTAWLKSYTSNFAWPVSKDLNPGGWPIPAVPFVNGITSALSNIPGLSPALATAIGWAIFHTLMIFWPFGQQAIALAQLAIVPAIAVLSAAGGTAVVAGAATTVGIAVPLSVATPLATAAAAPAGALPVPGTAGVVPTVSHAPMAHGPTATTVANPVGGGPAGGGAGVGFGPTATDSTGSTAGIGDSLYAVGLSGLSAKGSASSRARDKVPEPNPDDVDAPAAAAAAAAGRARRRRRMGGDAKVHGNRYEYLDPEPVAASDAGAGPVGFAGAAPTFGAQSEQAAGLITLATNEFDDAPGVPMLPSSWGDGGQPG
ncbi:PPE family protein [Mycobacterium kubicae]|uniref:PPE family protein n=1 Tax=Mycobacterium kubicae TaxID=120959 RepID=UPI001640F54E|nr:PPE family protein [Mycobacterium kubicae]QNI07365.1 PPE family protein [Mycobacterium kubicae]